jgi:SAM-dependent methyltransferase
MPEHIDEARQFAVECKITNIDFHAADFAAATDMNVEGFDYIVTHGVYSWIGKQAQADLRRFIDRHLKPGGLVYVSYYAMPGRAADLPFQRLVRAIGRTLPGDNATACASAIEIVNKFTAVKAPALVASPMASQLNEHPEKFPVAHLAHEYMAENWDPLCVTDVRAAMATIGLEPVGGCTHRKLRFARRGRADVAGLNQAIRARLDGPNEIPHVALPCVTAVRINDAVRGFLSGDQQADAGEIRPWGEYLAAHSD